MIPPGYELLNADPGMIPEVYIEERTNAGFFSFSYQSVLMF